MKHPTSPVGHRILTVVRPPLHPQSPTIYSGQKPRQEPSQGPSPPLFHHSPTGPGAMQGNLQIKGQSRLVNYNLSPVGGAGQGVQRIPRPTPKAWGRGVPKETGSRPKILLGVGEDRRRRRGLGANVEDAPGRRNNWGYSSKVDSHAVKASSENKLGAPASPGAAPWLWGGLLKTPLSSVVSSARSKEARF